MLWVEKAPQFSKKVQLCLSRESGSCHWVEGGGVIIFPKKNNQFRVSSISRTWAVLARYATWHPRPSTWSYDTCFPASCGITYRLKAKDPHYCGNTAVTAIGDADIRPVTIFTAAILIPMFSEDEWSSLLSNSLLSRTQIKTGHAR